MGMEPVVGGGGGGKSVVVAGMNGDVSRNRDDASFSFFEELIFSFCSGSSCLQLQIYDLRFLPRPSSSHHHQLPTSFVSSSSQHHNKPKPPPSSSFSTPTTLPTLSLPSHVNSYTTGLALLYHASSETVLAAGQDRKVRVWEARTGRLVEEEWGRKTTKSAAEAGGSGSGGWGGTVKGLVDLGAGAVGSVDGERWEVWE